MANGQRTLNDLNAMKFMNTPVNMPMPAPAMPYLPTPHDVSMQYFGQMNVAAHARFGYQQIGQFNTPSPIGLGGQYAPNANMMMPAGLSVFRPPPTPLPPPLMTTPGVTGAFHRQMDIGTQQALGAAGAYLDPTAGAKALARRNAGAVGGYVGGAIGGAAGGYFGGGAGALKGASWGYTIGDMFGGVMADIPILGDLIAWGEKEEAQALSNMAGVQFGTMGRVSMGRRDIGLGGRGINAPSAMRLGQNLQAFSNVMGGVKQTAVSGGAFNEADIRNLVQATADSGLLDAATNIDQIEGTVKKVMTLVGRLGKLTGDPDFRNNIRELGKMKMLGFEMDQAVDAMASMGRYGIAAGMSRTQLMREAVEPAMARFAAAGLAPGLGMTHGAYGAAQGRMQAGIGTAIQQSLMGDVGQRVTEANAAFLSGHARMLLPNLFAARGGEIVLDPGKINEIATAGVINLREMAATGRQTMVEVAQQVAEQRARAERREVRPGEFRDILGEMTSRQQEWLSELGTRMTPEQTMRANLAMAAGLQKQGLGRWESLMAVAGGDPMQARMLLNTATDPKYHERNIAQLDEQIKKAEADAMQLGRARASKWAEEHRAGILYKGLRGIGRGISDIFTDEVDVDDLMEAEEEARQLAAQEEAATYGTKTFRQAVTGGGPLSQRILKAQTEMQKGAFGGMAGRASLGSRTWIDDIVGQQNIRGIDPITGQVDITIGEGKLSEEEMIRMQRMTGEYGTLSGWAARNRYLLGALDIGVPLGIGVIEGAKAGRYEFQGTRKEYNRLMKSAADTARTVQKVEGRSREMQDDLEDKFKKKFKEWGVDGADVMADVKARVLAELSSRGKQGKATTSDDIFEMVQDSLKRYKGPGGKSLPAGAAKAFLDANKTMVQEVFTKFGMQESEEAGRGSIMEAAAVGTAFEKYTTNDQLDNLEDLQETMHDDLLQWLKTGGVADVNEEWWGLDEFEEVGQRKAFASIREALGREDETARGAAEETYLTALYAQARSGTQAEKKSALKKIEQLKSQAKERGKGAYKKLNERLDRAKNRFDALDEEGKKSLGNYLQMFHKKAKEAGIEVKSGEDMLKLLEQAQQGQGPLAMLASPEQLQAIVKQFKGGGKVQLEEGAFGVDAPAKKKDIDKLKGEKKSAEDLHALWTAPGGIADKFDSGMGKLQKATQSLAYVAERLSQQLP